MQKWEYQRISTRDEDELLPQLNALGQEGWELVSMEWRTRQMEQFNDLERIYRGEVVAYLKRPALEAGEAGPAKPREPWAV